MSAITPLLALPSDADTTGALATTTNLMRLEIYAPSGVQAKLHLIRMEESTKWIAVDEERHVKGGEHVTLEIPVEGVGDYYHVMLVGAASVPSGLLVYLKSLPRPTSSVGVNSVAAGGTGAATLTAHGVLVGEGTSAVVGLAAGTDGVPVLGAGASADPTTTTRMAGKGAADVADANVVGGLPLVHRVLVASGANGNVDVTLTHKSRVINAWFVMKGAGTAGCLLTLKNGATAITESFDCAASLDKAVNRFASIDDAQHEIAAAGTLRLTKASTGGDFPGAEVYVEVLRVA